MRACSTRSRSKRLRCVPIISGGPSPLPLSHPGEGFYVEVPVLLGDRPQPYPRPPNLPYNPPHPIPEGRPTGGMSFGGVGAAPAGGFAPHSREVSGTDLGTLRSLREELARPRRLHKPARQKRGPELSNRRWRSATGRADGGSIHPRRFLAQWKRNTKRASRRSAAPHMRQRPQGEPAGGDDAWAREARGTPLPDGRGAGVRARR